MEAVDVRKEFWKGKRALVTGHTGFKGSWLCLWLLELGAQVIGYALPPNTEEDNYVVCGLSSKLTDIRGNILEQDKLEGVFRSYQPEIVFHLAAQPLVRLSYAKPKLTYETNVIGTLNVLEAARKAGSVRSGVMVTTDKCYENRELKRGYTETDPMGGYDPYSASKGCAELLIASYRNSYLKGEGSMAVASARAGNVIGGGDWSVDRLIPDCVRALQEERPIVLRNPGAIRPWQFVLEPLKGYLMLAQRLWEEKERFAEGWNFGPDAEQNATAGEVAGRIADCFGKEKLVHPADQHGPHEDKVLLLDSRKAKERLGWRPRLGLDQTLRWTAQWYLSYQTESPYDICQRQLNAYLMDGDGEQEANDTKRIYRPD